MEIKSFSALNDPEHGYSAHLDARLYRPSVEVEIAVSISSRDGSPESLAKCILGMVEDLAGVLADPELIDRRAEDF